MSGREPSGVVPPFRPIHTAGADVEESFPRRESVVGGKEREGGKYVVEFELGVVEAGIKRASCEARTDAGEARDLRAS